MPSLECLVGQLIASVEGLKHDMDELKDDMRALRVELKADTKELAEDLTTLTGLKNKGIGILLAVGAFFTAIGWLISHFLHQ